MIVGVVQHNEGRIRLELKAAGRAQEIEAIIDTGYTGSLTLPPGLIAALGLPWQCLDRGTLADGSERLFDVYEANVVWDGKAARVLVDAADIDPLVGMELLKGYEVRIQVRPGGNVTIKRLPRPRHK